MNTHGDHLASCLCCQFCELDFEDDLSDVTPGAGWNYDCSKGFWNEWYPVHPGDVDLHEIILKGNNCPVFIARKKDSEKIDADVKYVTHTLIVNGQKIEAKPVKLTQAEIDRFMDTNLPDEKNE